MRRKSARRGDIGLQLALLCDALDIGTGGTFLFAVCEEGALRELLMRHVREHVEASADRSDPTEAGRDLIELELSPERPDLAGQLAQRLAYERSSEGDYHPTRPTAERVRERPRPPVVFVHTRKLADAGLDVAHLPNTHPERAHVEQVRRALRALNLQRERLTRFGVPLVFWLTQDALGQVTHHAADVFAARGGLFFFQAFLQTPGAPPPVRAEVSAELLDQFHRTLLPPDELRRRAALYERRLAREQAAGAPHWPRVALLCRDLANIHRELDDYARAGEFQDAAIEAYREAISELEAERQGDKGTGGHGDKETRRQGDRGQEARSRKQEAGSRRQGAGGGGREWAELQVWLGLAYYGRIHGDRGKNLGQAIACYREALTVYTPEAVPLDYAMTQNNLGLAYADLPTGDPGQNLAHAIQCYREALTIYTPEAAPLDYATAQNNLGAAYRSLPTGDRGENLRRAIQCYREALRFRTPEAAPLDYATTQNNLGNAYADLPTGDRGENLARAIECYREALRFRTPEAAPLDYATTQNNLGNAYADLPTGDRGENLRRAIQCYREALRFRTPETGPLDCATTQNNLGNAYANLPTGDRGENLTRAIECYRDALEILTAEAFPYHHEITKRNLEQALSGLDQIQTGETNK